MSRRSSTPRTRARRKQVAASRLLRLELLEDRTLLSATGLVVLPVTVPEGQPDVSILATFASTDPQPEPGSAFQVSVDWGDGHTSTGEVAVPTTPANFQVLESGAHNYAEEGSYTFTVKIVDSIDSTSTSATGVATVFDATLLPGNPVNAGTPVAFSGVGTANAGQSLKNFETAIGGSDNQQLPPQLNGFRSINWDAVKLDGTDFGGNSTVVKPGSTVGIPINRFQSRGVEFQEVYAVSGDGFVDVNPKVTGLFPAFSPKNTFAMFNDPTIDLSFVLPSDGKTTSVPSATRAFGAIFLNVTKADTTFIEYFNGDTSLGAFSVPVGTPSQPEFLGEVFANPIITRVHITLGDGVLFKFDGTTSTAGDDPATHNLVVTDDFAYAEPAGALNLPTPVDAIQGQPFTGAVATFSDTDPAAQASDFTAVIDWGDGNRSPGTIVVNGNGGFNITGTNLFTATGTFNARVLVEDFGGSSVVLTNRIQVTAPPFPTGPLTLAAVPFGSGASATQAIFVIRPDQTLWFREGVTGIAGWTKVNIPSPVLSVSAMTQTTDGHPVAFAQTTDKALFRFDAVSGAVLQIGGAGSINTISAGTDASGQADVFISTTAQDLIEYNSKGFQPKIGGNGSIGTFVALKNDAVVAVTTDRTVFEHNNTFGWFPLSSSNFASSVSAVNEPSTGHDVVFVQRLDSRLTRLDVGVGATNLEAPGTIPTAIGQVTQQTAAGTDNSGAATVFLLTNATATNPGQLVEDDPTTGRSVFLPLPGTVTRISADGSDRVFMILTDGSVFGHDSNGFFRLSDLGFAIP